MPEITSVETIRAKLRQFDERVVGAVTAAETLSRIKKEAENLLVRVNEVLQKGQDALQTVEGVELRLQQLSNEWNALNRRVDGLLTEATGRQDRIIAELSSAMHSLGDKVTEAEGRLSAKNAADLAEQAQVLTELDANTRVNAEAAAKARTFVAETAGRLDGLVGTLREELQDQVRSRLTQAEELLASEIGRIENYLTQDQKAFREMVDRQSKSRDEVLKEEMKSFKEEMKANLSEHQHAIDRQLTDFLNKQNALIQNLSQQIDGFHRVSQAQSADLGITNGKLNEIAAALQAYKATSAEDLAGRTSELKSLISDIQTRLRTEEESSASLRTSLRDTAGSLDLTLHKLKQLPLVGAKFR